MVARGDLGVEMPAEEVRGTWHRWAMKNCLRTYNLFCTLLVALRKSLSHQSSLSGALRSEENHSCCECRLAICRCQTNISCATYSRHCQTGHASTWQTDINVQMMLIMTNDDNAPHFWQGTGKACDCRHADVGEHDPESNTYASGSVASYFCFSLGPSK